MSFTEQIITIAAVVAGTMLTRFLPFILFPANKKTPPLVAFLGKMLPAAVMGMLVVYSLKDTQILSGSHGAPEAIAVALTVILQATLRNLLLTIAAGTIGYMLYAAGAICVYVKNVRKQAQRYQQSCNTEDNIPHIYNGKLIFYYYI